MGKVFMLILMMLLTTHSTAHVSLPVHPKETKSFMHQKRKKQQKHRFQNKYKPTNYHHKPKANLTQHKHTQQAKATNDKWAIFVVLIFLMVGVPFLSALTLFIVGIVFGWVLWFIILLGVIALLFALLILVLIALAMYGASSRTRHRYRY